MEKEPDLNEVTENLLKAIYQFRFVYKSENFPYCRNGADSLRPSDVMLLFTLERANRTAANGTAAGVSASDLSRLLRVKPPTITPILSRLEARRMIARRPDSNDRRSVRVRLLPEGSRLLADHRAALLGSLRGLVAYLGTGRSVELTSLINDVFAYFLSNRIHKGPAPNAADAANDARRVHEGGGTPC